MLMDSSPLRSKSFTLTHVLLHVPTTLKSRLSELLIATSDVPFRDVDIRRYDDIPVNTFNKFLQITKSDKVFSADKRCVFLVVDRYSDFTEIELPHAISGKFLLVKFLSSERGATYLNAISASRHRDYLTALRQLAAPASQQENIRWY